MSGSIDYIQSMEQPETMHTLVALAHDTRLKVYRLLEAAGDGGMAAGEIADRLEIHPASLSNHLGILTRAGVVSQERRGRSLVYRSAPERVRALARLLVDG